MEQEVYPIAKQSLADQVYGYVKRLILSGELQGGERIPEQIIARRFGVSRTPIREALMRLEEYGLVTLKPRSYGEVAQLEPSEAVHIAQIRAQLETLAVELLSKNGTEQDFHVLQNLSEECSRLLEEEDVAGMFDKDSQFHLEITRRSRNPHLFEIVEKFDAKVQLLRLVLHLPYDKLKQYVGQHEEIINLMRRGNSREARDLMEQHVLNQIDDYTPLVKT
jgi:DNA-binding GntR family transcriptional regulator